MFDRAVEDISGRPIVKELQSLRGIAAVIVLVYHAALYLDFGAGPAFWMTTVVNAHAAVVSFFVLSGLVLTLSLMRAPLTLEEVGFFYLRRAFRIYPALWFACGIATCFFLVLGNATLPAAGTAWASMNFAVWPLSWAKLALAFAGIKPYLPVPIWSLAVELIGSLAMPLVLLSMHRSVWAFAALTLGLAIVSIRASTGLVLVPNYLVDFALGAGIALAVPAWRRAARRGWVVGIVALVGFGILWCARLMTGADFDRLYHQGAAATLEGVGAALLIGSIYVRPDCFRLLAGRTLMWLGDISYSLYLLHLPVLGVVGALAGWIAPVWIGDHPGIATLALVAATAAVTLPVADWAFRRIELPTIGASQRALRRLKDRLHPPEGMPIAGWSTDARPT
ncbi:acyltransferase family protein [Sphingomonas sp. 1P08PE]|uniref:acyltransferase family protein n=1 Tax=Sphingomonas sp. 1P08PE TaxID=554122 RepID=UPI0039A28A95